MIMMMTDSDRVAFARISACICVLFHSPLHAVVNAHLPPECPSCNLSHHIIPILVFHSHQLSSFHFTSTFRPSQTRHHLSRLLPSSSSFHSTSQPVLCHFYLFLQPTTIKNLQSKSLPHLPSFFASQHAPTHPFAFAYLCIYYPWWYLSRTKKKDLLGKGGARAPQKSRS